MPLTINVGLSRKSSQNFQSRGTSINVTAELDQSLLSKPEQLQREIDGLYRQAEQALDHRMNGSVSNGVNPASNGRSPDRPITASQLRALHAIADRMSINLDEHCRRQHNCDVKELSITEASRLIDHLKAAPPQEPSSVQPRRAAAAGGRRQ